MKTWLVTGYANQGVYDGDCMADAVKQYRADYGYRIVVDSSTHDCLTVKEFGD